MRLILILIGKLNYLYLRRKKNVIAMFLLLIFSISYKEDSYNRPPKRVYIKDSSNHNIRRRAHRLPRLIKRDMRRIYSIMFINTLNSGDLNLLDSFISMYLSPQCSINFYDNTLHQPTVLESNRSIALKHELKFVYLKFPDIIFSINNYKTEILGKYDSEELIIKFEMKTTGTMLSYECIKVYNHYSHLLLKRFNHIQSYIQQIFLSDLIPISLVNY